MNKILYQSPLSRLSLLKLPLNSNDKQISISVHRNHSFEIIASTLNIFLNESGFKATFTYSDYDDSLNFQCIDADIHIIWIDIRRYHRHEISDFLKERAAVLRMKTQSPIIIAYTCEQEISLECATTDCFIIYVDTLIAMLGDGAYDVGKEKYSGTILSGMASMEMARQFGLRYIPAILKTSIKAIVIDLDNTLYDGVLGEDGIDHIKPNIDFQKYLHDLKEDGILLCISSKNEEIDVRNMFENRHDFKLKWDDFTSVEINWNQKSENIVKIANKLNIGFDSILFIDDNPAEIENVSHIGVKTLLADGMVDQAIRYYPGLLRLRKSSEDSFRSLDIQANAERARLASQLSTAEYFAKLGIKLEYFVNDVTQIARVSELFCKTNQFILTYARYNETDVYDFMHSKGKCIVTIRMSDNLSDSGIIAILAAHAQNDVLYLDELTVSCRALGRKLEMIMLPELFIIASNHLKTHSEMHIKYKHGPRNAPAMMWLNQLTGTSLIDDGDIVYSIPNKIDMSGLNIEITNM